MLATEDHDKLRLAEFAALEPINSHTHIALTTLEFVAMLQRLHVHVLDVLVVNDRQPLGRPGAVLEFAPSSSGFTASELAQQVFCPVLPRKGLVDRTMAKGPNTFVLQSPNDIRQIPPLSQTWRNWMKHHRSVLPALLVCFLFVVAIARPAYAYIDPNAAGLVSQIITPLLVAAAAGLTFFRKRIAELFSSVSRRLRRTP